MFTGYGKIIVVVSLFVTVALAGASASGVEEKPEKPSVVEAKMKAKDLFLKYYEPVKIEVHPSAPQYRLPVDTSGMLEFKKQFPGVENEAALKLFAKNGFVVTIPKAKYTQLPGFYDRLSHSGIPVFVTSDTVLHLYHILFDNLLMEIEQKSFRNDLSQLTREMVRVFDRMYTDDAKAARPVTVMTSAYRRNVAYFSVAAKLLDEDFEVPGYVEKEVSREIALIEKHSGFQESPLFTYKEDYSQYVPRGHYTRSPELESYFKAMMWYGRMTFLLKGKTAEVRDAIVTDDVARMQTRQAIAIQEALTQNKELFDKWQKIYTVTAFFVGFSDDLTVEDYAQAIQEYLFQTRNPDVHSDQGIDRLRREFAKMASPAIYGGTGNIVVEKPVTEEDLDKALDKTMGMRFFGQRFIPDSYFMGRLVGMAYTGKDDPFSKVTTPIGPIRGFPRGLDVMAVLGSDRSSEILDEHGDDEYVKYDDTVRKLKQELTELDNQDWHQNLYWGWLAALRTLLVPLPSGYPTFMRTEAWEDRYLEEACASWSQLRHDTILYAKQSYGMVGSAMPPQTKPKGYIEPSIELYSELLSLNKMMQKGLDDFGLLDRTWSNRLGYVNTLLDRLIDLSTKELEGKELAEQDMRFIEHFGGSLNGAIGDLLPKSTTTAIIADVHTEPNSKQVVEEGTGALHVIWVACPLGDGKYFVCAGPVLSYYEFKHPMSDRLTDEKWQKMIEQDKEPEMDIFKKP